MIKVSFLISICLFFQFAQADRFRNTDLKNYEVSILFPLPAGHDDNHLLSINSEGTWGNLIPQHFIEILPPLDPHQNQELTIQELRVVSIRLDPCFPAATAVEKCTSQIRMIWQPILTADNEKTKTLDESIHTFYQLPPEEFNQLLSKMKALRTNGFVEGSALGVHPIIQQQGLLGSYFRELKKIILASTGSERLIKMTFMILAGEGIWEFGGFDLIAGQAQPIVIPRIGSTKESFYNGSKTNLDFFDGGPVPAPAGPDIFNILITQSSDVSSKNEQEIIHSVIGAAKVENPNIHNPHTIDCVSCHIAQAARIWSINHLPALTLDHYIDSVSFKSEYNLINLTANPEKTTMLRSFGYDGSSAFVNQRVINETAAVLEYLKRDFDPGQ